MYKKKEHQERCFFDIIVSQNPPLIDLFYTKSRPTAFFVAERKSKFTPRRMKNKSCGC